MTGDTLDLRFARVLEDSRCPELAECFWTGQARIAIVADSDDGVPMTLEFNTNPAPGLTVPTAQVGDYSVTLQSLDPYPQTPEDRIGFADYRVTLVVHRD